MAHSNTVILSVRHSLVTFMTLLVLMSGISLRMEAQPAVGSVNGALTVSEMGAAVYSVSFDVPGGGRMAPQVGLAYNSQSAGYGLAGYGIDITGLSVITAGGRDMFHNGKVRGANYDGDSNLYLDGKRLVLQSGDDCCDGAEYAPEGDPHTKIVLHGTIETNCANTWFEVHAKDGTVYLYGQSSDSKLRTRKGSYDRVAAWYISNAQNKYGESIKYNYSNSGVSVRPQTITYGTERGLTCKVEFAYRNIASGNERKFRVGDYEGSHNVLLASVTTSMNGSMYRRYDFQYDETASDHFSRLTTITESNGAGEELNPTVLTWNTDYPTEIEHTNISDFSDDSNSSQYMAVDMNGDGIADLLRLCYGLQKTEDGLYTEMMFLYVYCGSLDSKGNVKYSDPQIYTYPYFPNLGEGHLKFSLGVSSVMDFDGDGLNDIFLSWYGNSEYYKKEILYILPGKYVVQNIGRALSGISFDIQHGDSTPLYTNLDMDGDGLDEVILFESGSDGGKYRMHALKYKEAEISMDKTWYAEDFYLPSAPKRLFTNDYNGDGLTDLLVVCSDSYKVFFNRGYTEGQKQLTNIFSDEMSYTSSTIRKYWRMEQGDFDGDGLADFFCHDSDTRLFSIAYNNGDGTFRRQTFADNWGVYEQSETDKDDNKFSVTVTDFDNDGKSDVVMVKACYKREIMGRIVYDRTQVRWLHSTGYGLELTRSYEFCDEDKTNESRMIVSDLDGDGKMEIASIGFLLDANNAVDNANTMHIYKTEAVNASEGRLTSVTDGFGNVTELSYAYATDNSVYSLSEKQMVQWKSFYNNDTNRQQCVEEIIDDYPVNRYTLPIVLVSSVRTPDTDISYGYKDLRLHIAGRGVMGFGTIEKTNNTLGITETTEVSKWDTRYWQPKETLTTTKILATGETATTQSSYAIADWGIWYNNENIYTDFEGNKQYRNLGIDYETGLQNSSSSGASGASTEYSEPFHKEETNSEFVYQGGTWHIGHKDIEQIHEDDGNSALAYEDYTYDDHGNMTRRVTTGMKLDDEQYDFVDGESVQTDYTYDDMGNVLSETFQGNDESIGHKYYEYDPTGRFVVKTYTVPESTTTTYTYDQWGHLLTETDETNTLHPLTTTYEYDNWGRRTRTVFPDGTETICYTDWEDDINNTGGWFTQTYGTAIPYENHVYDSQGRETEYYTTKQGCSLTTVNTYNVKGQVEKTETQYGKRRETETFIYDARGRIVSDQHSSGAGITYEYGRNTVTTTDAAGRSVTKTYDAWGNVKKVEDEGGNVEYTYYSNGKPASITTGGHTVTMEYDEFGRRTRLVDPDAGETVTTYDKAGHVLSETDGRGVVTSYSYDALGRVTERRREKPNDKNVSPSVTTYTYGTTGNSKGRIVEKSCDGSKLTYEYDDLGRVVSESRGLAYNHDGTRDELRKTYTYDSKGLLKTVTFPASHSSKGLTIGYSYDSDGTLNQMLYDNNLSNSLYRRYGNDGLKVQSRSDYLGDVTSLYDNNGHLISRDYDYTYYNKDYGRRGVRDTLTFSWDDVTGNLLSRTIKGRTETFSYDILDRLTGVSCNGGESMAVNYADNGNITGKSGIGEYSYSETDKPHAVREVENADGIIDSREVYTQYDLNGKVAVIWDKNYDTYMQYYYGPDDEKWSRWGWSPDDMDLGWDVERIYWGNYERLTMGNHIREYYFLDNDVMLMRENDLIDAGEPDIWHISYYQMERDNIGNIVAIYDLHHRKVFEAEYDAWGRQTVTTNEICFNYGYTGHEMLNEFGLIHMDGRVYDPAIGRFLSPDNYVQLPENSQSYNRYSYCINNPLKYTDPSGQSFLAVFAFATNFICNLASGDNFWAAYGKAYVSSTISNFSPAVSGAIGGIFGHSVGSFGNELLRAGAHGLASGVMNALQGENFGAGFASGAFASFAGSGAQWAGLGTGGVLGATTLFGGIGSASFGGDFLQGAMTGLSIGLYNHTWKEGGITYNDDNPNDITGLIDEVFVDNHLTLSPPTAPVEKGLELVFPEFEILTGIRAIFNGAFKAAGSISRAPQTTCTDLAPYYPPKNGALGPWEPFTLKPGTLIDRFGGVRGRFTSPYGTPLDMRAMPPSNTGVYNVYEVIQPIDVQSSTIAPWFGKIGFGTQYQLERSVGYYISRGYLKVVY